MDIEIFQNWLNKLGEAWSGLDSEGASDLFSKDVEYYESSLREQCKNWEEVRDLWKIIPSNQSDVNFHFNIVASHGDLCVANWQVERMLLPQGAKQNIDGIFIFKLNKGGLCYYFKQWRTIG